MIRLALPLIAASLVSAVIAPLLGRITPMAARRASMTALVSSAAAALALLAHLSMRGIVAIPVVGRRLHSFLHLDGVHVVRSGPVGATALVVAAVIVVKAVMMCVSRAKIRNIHPGGVVTVSDPRLFAYAVPGRRAGIIVSDSLVSTLSREEMDVVLRHEREHIDGRHDRWILAARLCALVNPLLLPMRRQLELSLERIADDSARRDCGDARTVVSTLSKVALGKPESSIALGITSSAVPARIHWLNSGGDKSPPVLVAIVALGTFSITSLAFLQGHHIASAIQAACS
jgi:Peptidase family M48